MIKCIGVIIAFLTICGCATPPGKLKEEDFSWATTTKKQTYQESYRRLDAGFKKCNYPADGNIFTDIQAAQFYVHLPDLMGTKSAWVLGKVLIESKDNGSIIKIGVQHEYDNPVFAEKGIHRKRWGRFLDGIYKDCE